MYDQLCKSLECFVVVVVVDDDDARSCVLLQLNTKYLPVTVCLYGILCNIIHGDTRRVEVRTFACTNINWCTHQVKRYRIVSHFSLILCVRIASTVHQHAIHLLLSQCIYTNDLILVEVEVYAFAPLSLLNKRCRKSGKNEICSEFHGIIPCDFETSILALLYLLRTNNSVFCK